MERKEREARLEREALQQQMKSMMEMMHSLNKQISATTIVQHSPPVQNNNREVSHFTPAVFNVSAQQHSQVPMSPDDDDPENPFKIVSVEGSSHSHIPPSTTTHQSSTDSKIHKGKGEHPLPEPQFFEPPPAYEVWEEVLLPSAPPLEHE